MEWKNPPAPRNGRRRDDWTDIAKELKSKPQEWALIKRKANSGYGSIISHGRLKAFTPAGSYEAVVRNVTTEGCDLYARYVGGRRGKRS